MANIFVTGATGFIGKNLLELLISKGENIIAFSNGNQNDIDTLMSFGVSKICTEKDLTREDLIVDSCIHLASYGVNYNDKNIETMIDVNIKLSSRIMEFCVNNGCKVFLNTGSCFEYGTQDVSFLSEELPTNPEDIYAATKVANNIILKTMALKQGIQFITCRPFGVYGKYEANGRILPLVYNYGKEKKRLDMTEGLQERDYLYVKDVASAFYEILKAHENFKQIDCVNICSGEPCTIKRFVETVISLKRFDSALFSFGKIPYRKNEAMRLVGSNKKIMALTNWRPYFSLENGLCDYFKYLEELTDGN